MLLSFLIVLCACFGAIADEHRPCYAPICEVNKFCHHRLPACARNASLSDATRSPWFEIVDGEIMGVPTKETDVLLTNSQVVGIRGSCSLFILVRNATEATKMGKCHESISHNLRVLHEALPPRIAIFMRHWPSKHSLLLLERRISLTNSLGIGRIGHDNVPFTHPLVQEQSDAAVHRGKPSGDAKLSEAAEGGRVHLSHSLHALPKASRTLETRVFHRDVTGGRFFRFEFPGGTDGLRVASTSSGVWVTIGSREIFGFTAVNEGSQEKASFDLESHDGERLVFELRISEPYEGWTSSLGKHEFITDIKWISSYLEREKYREEAMRMLQNVSKLCDLTILDVTDTHVAWICSDFDAEDVCSTGIHPRIAFRALNSENVTTNLTLRCPSPWRDRLIIFGSAFLMYLIFRICMTSSNREAEVDGPPKYERFDKNDRNAASKHEDEPPKYEDLALEQTPRPQEAAQIHQRNEIFSPEIDEVVRKDEQLV